MSNFTQKEFKRGLYMLDDSVLTELSSSKYYNDDLKPSTPAERTWTTYHIAMLWVGMVIAITSFSFAAALVSLGLSPLAAIINVAIGNLIVLIPMQLNSHAGTKYGIPFPVFAKISFGKSGAQLPSMARSIVAAGWCAVQCWVGGAAVSSIIGVFYSGWDVNGTGRFIGFFIFMGINLYIAMKGSEGIKWLEAIGSPILIFVVVGLLIWTLKLGADVGFTFGDLMAMSADNKLILQNGGWWFVFLAGITSNIAVWATLALNIPDFSRYAKGQKEQLRGQMFAMPISMIALAVIGALFAQVTNLAYGKAEYDPTIVLLHLDNKILILVVAIATIIATLTTNIAANIVAPANGFSNLNPKKISYKHGVIITTILCLAFRPWWMFGSAGAFMFSFLGTVGTILGPSAAIFVADYVIVKKKRVALRDLYTEEKSRYTYHNGWNIKAIIAWVVSFIFPLLYNNFGIGGTVMKWIGANSYIFGFVVGLVIYTLLMRNDKESFVTEKEFEEMTKKTYDGQSETA